MPATASGESPGPHLCCFLTQVMPAYCMVPVGMPAAWPPNSKLPTLPTEATGGGATTGAAAAPLAGVPPEAAAGGGASTTGRLAVLKPALIDTSSPRIQPSSPLGRVTLSQ